MATITFSMLPPEIHVSIAEHCDNKDLINLCLTSELMHQCYVRALYRHVDLQLDPDDMDYTIPIRRSGDLGVHERQEEFVRTLLSHPEYGRHVRSLKTNDFIPTFSGHLNDMPMQIKFWRAMQSLTHVQSVDLESSFPRGEMRKSMSFPNNLFPNAKSIRLVGQIQNGLARSILHAINPANLTHLCLDLVEENKAKRPEEKLFLGTMSGPLEMLKGRCTALQTLILRRIGDYCNHGLAQRYVRRREIANILSYCDWASFICSVKGTVEEFTFEQLREVSRYTGTARHEFGIMERIFSNLIIQAIISGNWPCLTAMRLRGIRDLNGRDGEPALMDRLRAVLGRDAKILVEEGTLQMEQTPGVHHSFEFLNQGSQW